MTECNKCNGSGWVCENHLNKEWENCGVIDCGGAGKNCLCNPSGAFPPGTVVKASVYSNEITKIH